MLWSYPQLATYQNEGQRFLLRWSCFGSCTGSVGGPINKLGRMVISRSERAYGYFLAMYSRLFSVARIFQGSAGPGLKFLLMHG